MNIWIPGVGDQAYLGMCIRYVAYRISDIEYSVRLEIRFYGYGIPAKVRLFDIVDYYEFSPTFGDEKRLLFMKCSPTNTNL